MNECVIYKCGRGPSVGDANVTGDSMKIIECESIRDFLK